MSNRWRMKMRGRRRVRLTGLSIPLAGVQWEYTDSDRDIVRHLLDFLESRRALWVPFNSERHRHVTDSVLLMRNRLTDVQEQLASKSPARSRVRLLRLACERFLTTPQESAELWFYSDLGELRRVFGAYLDDLIQIYGIEVSPPLLWLLPSTPREDLPDGLNRARGEVETEIHIAGPQHPSPAPPDEG